MCSCIFLFLSASFGLNLSNEVQRPGEMVRACSIHPQKIVHPNDIPLHLDIYARLGRGLKPTLVKQSVMATMKTIPRTDLGLTGRPVLLRRPRDPPAGDPSGPLVRCTKTRHILITAFGLVQMQWDSFSVWYGVVRSSSPHGSPPENRKYTIFLPAAKLTNRAEGFHIEVDYATLIAGLHIAATCLQLKDSEDAIVPIHPGIQPGALVNLVMAENVSTGTSALDYPHAIFSASPTAAAD